MNSPNTSSRRTTSLFKSTVVAVAFALPGLVAAGGTGEGVTTRTDTKLEQHHGRDSVYALSPEPMRLSAQVEPQRYGRAGGYVGSDRVEMSNSLAPNGSSQIGSSQTTAPAIAQPPMTEEGRTAGNRFDNPDSAHGQNETGVQTR